MRPNGSMFVAVLSALGVGVGACGGDAFTSGAGVGATGAGAGASSGGSGAVGPGSGGEGVGGAAGCGAGTYFSDALQTCMHCDDLTELNFGPLQQLMIGPGGIQAYGRVQTDGASERVVYAFAADAMVTSPSDLGTIAGGPPWSGGAAVTGAAINTDAFNDAGPLLLPSGVGFPGVDGTGIFLFHSDRSGVYKIYAAEGVASTTPPVELGGPINDGGGLDRDIAFAYAAPTPRAFWTTTRNGSFELVTATESSNVTHVGVVLPNGCVQPDPLTAWVTPKGDLLLVASEVLDSACVGTATDGLFAVPIDPATGQPKGPAQAIDSINSALAGKLAFTPSLSPDSCTLYLSVGAVDDLHVFSAQRR